jgi:hypothetical protein
MGWLIDPPQHLPAIEKFGKRLRHAAQWLVLCYRNRGLPPAVIAYPDLPSRRTTLYKTCQELGWELTNRPRSHTHVKLYIRYEDTTEKATALPAEFPVQAWNAGCVDIRKSTLDAHHRDLWGYGVGVDPLTHTGPLLEKGDGNALHDGRILAGPLQPLDLKMDKVYQRVISNRNEAGVPFDFRMVWMRGAIPVLYRKFKSESFRFTNETIAADIVPVEIHFTSSELSKIDKLMRVLSVDWAELDILRDSLDGKLYVVDVNPTPWGPPALLPTVAQKEALQSMASALREAILSDIEQA